MTSLYGDSDKFGGANASPVTEAFNVAVREIVRARLAAHGGSWADFVFGEAVDGIRAEDFAQVEKMMLDAGHRFAWSAAISAQERPDVYQEAHGLSGDLSGFSFEHPEAETSPPDADGRERRGQGDNVVRVAQDVVGTARYIRSPAQVLHYMTEGVPANTIAVIDDSGGTLTAPILEHFAGVICAGGTTRSHLGILTREYGVPCLMNAKISGIFQGDTVRIECSADPKTAADYQKNITRTARIWRVASAS